MVSYALKLASAVATLCVVATSGVHGHSFLVKPVARDAGYRSDTTNTMGCPSKKVGKVSSFEAGETIDVRYWRNNHIGGFIRWSLVPRGEESHDNFDKNTFYYTCRESGPDCVPKKNPDRPITGDSSGTNTISCGDTIKLPDWLPAGDYVLQWTWFGVGHSNGNLGWAEPQFQSCADIKLTTKGNKAAAPKCPTFVGGDRITKSQNKTSNQCFYFYTTDIVGDWYKGSNAESVALPLYKYGVPKPVERCLGGAGTNNNGTATDDDEDDDKTGNDTDVSPTPVPSTKGPSTAPPSKAPTPAKTPAPTTASPLTTSKPTTNQPAPASTSASCRRKDD